MPNQPKQSMTDRHQNKKSNADCLTFVWTIMSQISNVFVLNLENNEEAWKKTYIAIVRDQTLRHLMNFLERVITVYQQQAIIVDADDLQRNPGS